eukprot:gene33089-38361_t
MSEEVDFEEEMVEATPAPPAEVSHAEQSHAAAPEKVVTTKGRGHGRRDEDESRYDTHGGVFERIEQSTGPGPIQSIEGWIVFVSGVHAEATEEDILDKFSEFGDVKNIHVNLDRRTGFVKGYALVEYVRYEDARSAIRAMDGKKILEQTLRVDWAFTK